MATKKSKHAVTVSEAPDMRADSWVNVLTRIGTAGDKRLARNFGVDNLLRAQNELDDLYAGDDIIARVVDIVPHEMIREGIAFKCDGDPEIAKKVATWLEDLQVMQRLQKALIYARLYGGAVCILGVDDGQPSNMPLKPEKVKGFYWLTTLDRFSMRPDLPYADPFSPRYGQPSFYFVQNQLGTSQGEPTRFNDAIHESRLLRFDGITTTPRRQQQNLTWGESILIRVLPIVADFQQTWQSVSYLMTDMAQAVFTIKGLAKQIAANKSGDLEKRFQLLEMSRSVARAIVLDEGETFERKSTPLSEVPALLDKFANRLAASVGIPVTLLLGEAPKGLNATGDADVRFFYDQVKASQEKLLRPALNRILTLALNAANGPTGGKEPENWSFEFKPLWQLDSKQEAERRFSIAQADNIYLQAGVLTPEEVANSRFSADGYSVETNLDQDMRDKLNDGSAMGAMTKALMKGVSTTNGTRSSETGTSRLDPQRMSQPSGTEVEDSGQEVVDKLLADYYKKHSTFKKLDSNAARKKANQNKTKHPPTGAPFNAGTEENGGMASGNPDEQEEKGELDFTGDEEPLTGSNFSSSEDDPAPMDFTGLEQPATGGNEKGIALVPSETIPDEIESKQQRQPGGEGPIVVRKKRPKGAYGNTEGKD